MAGAWWSPTWVFARVAGGPLPPRESSMIDDLELSGGEGESFAIPAHCRLLVRVSTKFKQLLEGMEVQGHIGSNPSSELFSELFSEPFS